MHRDHGWKVGHSRFGQRVPVTDDCTKRAKHIELRFAGSSQIRVNEGGLLARGEGNGHLGVIGIRRMCPNTLVVLPAHMRNIVGDYVENLVDEVTTPIVNRTTRHCGIRMPIVAGP